MEVSLPLSLNFIWEVHSLVKFCSISLGLDCLEFEASGCFLLDSDGSTTHSVGARLGCCGRALSSRCAALLWSTVLLLRPWRSVKHDSFWLIVHLEEVFAEVVLGAVSH